MNGPDVTLVEVAPGRRVAVHDLGGHGPVALLAHGAGSSADFVARTLAEPLGTAGWHPFGIDLRGHAHSDPAPQVHEHRIASHAADLTLVAERLGAVVIGGLSVGAMAAVTAAATGTAVEGVLAVIPGWTGPSQPGVGVHAVLAREAREVGADGIVARLEAARDMPEWVRTQVLRDYRRHDPGSLVAALIALDGDVGPSESQLADLPCPLAVVGWHDDPGHPLKVARAWAATASPSGFASVTLDDMARDVTSLGRAAVVAMADAGITATPSWPAGSQ